MRGLYDNGAVSSEGGGIIAGDDNDAVGSARSASSRRTQYAPNARRADGSADTASRPIRCIDCVLRPGTGGPTRPK